MRLFVSAGFCGCIAFGVGRPTGVAVLVGAGGSLAQPDSRARVSSDSQRQWASSKE